MALNALSATFDMQAIDGMLDKLESGIADSLRPAAQAGAQVFYDAVVNNPSFPVSEVAHYFYGTHGVYGPYEPGTLKGAVYQAFSQDNSNRHQATYHVSWNYQKAPYGFMVEFGTSRAKANPFLGPALARTQAAMDALEQRLAQELMSRGAIDS